MKLLDGKALASIVLQELAKQSADIVKSGGRSPHLAAVLVGDHPASLSYVGNKVKSCETAGFKSTLIHMPGTITQKELLDIVIQLNNDPEVDGYIIQLPLPRHIDADEILLTIDPRKDVDGFHPENFGRMAQGLPAYLPATPMGIMTMLERHQIETSGKRCVVLGRSNIVGTPMALLLSRRGYPGDCTVTIAHSRTENIAEICREADILVAALGQPLFVKEDMVKHGAVVIDVGINRISDSEHPKGYRLVGDVDYDRVAHKCSAITPVPGGVGPMTVCALMMNTLKAAQGLIYPK